MPDQSQVLADVVARALEFVPGGSVVGLGSGRAATAFIKALGARVQAGFAVRGVPTSGASATLAAELGIPLTTLAEVAEIDVDVDGADEVDPACHLIKGYGGALLREKIVAAASRQLVILVGPEKIVQRLGERGKLPVEVVPFGVEFCRRRLEQLGYTSTLRMTGSDAFVTDNGNSILDCHITPQADPVELEQRLRAIPGVVETGLFLNMSPTVLIGGTNGVEVRRPS